MQYISSIYQTTANFKEKPRVFSMLYHNFYFGKKLVTYIYQFKSNRIETNRGTLERHGYFGYVDSGVLN